MWPLAVLLVAVGGPAAISTGCRLAHRILDWLDQRAERG